MVATEEAVSRGMQGILGCWRYRATLYGFHLTSGPYQPKLIRPQKGLIQSLLKSRTK